MEETSLRQITVEGKTVEEAIELGLKELGTSLSPVSREEVDIEILESGKEGFLGLLGKPAKVLLSRRVGAGDATARALSIVRDILQRMEIDAEVDGEKKEEAIEISIMGAGGVLIGRQGETLSAFQYLVNRIFNAHKEPLEKTSLRQIIVDVENYRERRKNSMIDRALELYRGVVETGKAVSIKNLSPADRRIVHMTLRDREEVRTYSQGEGRFRIIVIEPRNPEESGQETGTDLNSEERLEQ